MIYDLSLIQCIGFRFWLWFWFGVWEIMDLGLWDFLCYWGMGFYVHGIGEKKSSLKG